MSIGKTAAQAGHAAIMFLVHHLTYNIPFSKVQMDWLFEEKLKNSEWNYGGMRKIVLAVNDLQELLQLVNFAQQIDIEAHLVFDEGLDCITCASLGPDAADKIDIVTDHLTLLGK
jgi:peptidyl-tRNA hydrolase